MQWEHGTQHLNDLVSRYKDHDSFAVIEFADFIFETSRSVKDILSRWYEIDKDWQPDSQWFESRKRALIKGLVFLLHHIYIETKSTWKNDKSDQALENFLIDKLDMADEMWIFDKICEYEKTFKKIQRGMSHP
jgi:hypothetical protein